MPGHCDCCYISENRVISIIIILLMNEWISSRLIEYINHSLYNLYHFWMFYVNACSFNCLAKIVCNISAWIPSEHYTQ